MSRVLDDAAFRAWLASDLPETPPNLLYPATVSDRADRHLAHLDGLDPSRAWCWRILAPFFEGVGEAIQRHLEATLPQLNDDFMGEHWLTTYAVLALSG